MHAMADMIFTRIALDAAGFALYSAAVDQAIGVAPVQAGFLLLPGGAGASQTGVRRDEQAPQELSLSQAWQQPGYFLFHPQSQALPAEPADIAQTLGLTPPYATLRGVAWLWQAAAPQSWACTSVPLFYFSPTSGQVAGSNGSLPFGHVDLVLPSGTQWTLSAETGQATFVGDGIALLRDSGQGTPLSPDAYRVSLSFDPAAAGLLRFTAAWDPYNLFGLFADDPQAPGLQGGELRYFHPDPQAPQGFTQLRYPVLPPLPPLPANDWPAFLLDCEMDPLAPLDGTRTRFLFLPQRLDNLASSFGRTVSGDLVTLAPSVPSNGSPAGLYPAARPGAAQAPAAYLAPLGPFVLTVPGGAAKLSCGTLGTEYLRVADGDILDFVPSMPACSTAFGTAMARRMTLADGADTKPLLDGPFATSWVRFRPGAATAMRGYYAQPGASVNFGRGAVSPDMRYPAAVSALVSTLASTTKSDEIPVAFPMVQYGGVFALADATVQDAQLLAGYEKQVIAGLRGALIRGSTPDRPVFVGEQGAPLPGTRTSTPQGLLVQLNSATQSTRAGIAAAQAPEVQAGTWQSLLLARSAEQTLSFDADPATGVVDAQLASTLMREQLFLVLNDWSRFPNITRMIAVAGFNFEIAPDVDATDRWRTVVVFKYATTQSLAELIRAPESWANTEYFIGDATRVTDTQSVLIDALAVAEKASSDDDDPFADFRTKAADPGWTGMLAFNAPINGNGMPDDLQMLLAGIDGQLSAHHFGVQVNRISDGADQEPQISESALFGVIYHHAATAIFKREPAAPHSDQTPPDYAFVVEELSVAINQSLVTQFHCRVGMTINTLFGRAVTLTGADINADVPPNTVVVAGRYQRHGEVGTVTFDGGQHGSFAFNPDRSRIRVIDTFQVSGASLVPIASVPSVPADADAGTTITSRFALSGTLAFAADPFPGVTGLDLFSYGLPGAAPGTTTTGVALTSLAFGISCQLDADGKRIGLPQITVDFSGLRATDDRSGRRPGALVRMLPLTLQAILHDEAGLDIKALGALPVQVPALTGVAASVPGGGGVAPMPTQVAYVTSKPLYALQFALPLGALGALADAHASLDASLIVAWGASTYTPDDDGVALFVQLPQVTAGAFGFNLQGLLKTTFSAANLGLVKTKNGPAYVLMFNNVALSVFGITLPPKVLADFILFADANDPGGGNLGWSLAATQTP